MCLHQAPKLYQMPGIQNSPFLCLYMKRAPIRGPLDTRWCRRRDLNPHELSEFVYPRAVSLPLLPFYLRLCSISCHLAPSCILTICTGFVPDLYRPRMPPAGPPPASAAGMQPPTDTRRIARVPSSKVMESLHARCPPPRPRSTHMMDANDSINASKDRNIQYIEYIRPENASGREKRLCRASAWLAGAKDPPPLSGQRASSINEQCCLHAPRCRRAEARAAASQVG